MSKKVFPKLRLYIEELQKSKELILTRWIHTPAVAKRLQGSKIGQEEFKKKYASAVYDYFLGVVGNSEELGNCPVIIKMLADFKQHHIPLDELFIICVSLKNHLIFLLQDIGVKDKNTIAELMVIMDANFSGVMNRYIKMNYEHLLEDMENKKELQELEANDLITEG